MTNNYGDSLKHEVWIDTSKIKVGKESRERITKGIFDNDVVQLEKAAKLRIYPMCIESRVGLPSDMKDNCC